MSQTETVRYDDAVVRKFVVATLVWGAVGMLVGLWIALELAVPSLNHIGKYFTFGRLRPLHTNAVIFAFAGNAIFAAVYYSSQRLLKTRMFSDKLSAIHFWGWQLIIVCAAITLPLGITQGKEYAELEWPIDILVAAIWVTFALNMFGTLKVRRERHIYVAIWFYLATIVAITVLHIFNNLVIPAGLFKSYSIYGGVQDAFMQWWYGHNAVGFFLTTPFLGLMYYFLPKAAGRPVYSYRLSILHFWSLVFIYIWAGPHHLHYTALPAWASTLGMVFSVMLWMPSWGGMFNGLLTLRGAWSKVDSEPVLKFYVVGLTFYGMSTFEGPLMSIKSVNALSHYTNWTIAHVHAGALGWVGFMTFGMIYWLWPRLWRAELYSKKLANLHFWVGTIGILLYVISMWTAGLTEGLVWRAIGTDGKLQYDFLDGTRQINWMNWVRALGGAVFIAGLLIMAYNLFKTWQRRPETLPDLEVEVPARSEMAPVNPEPGSHPKPWHRRWEGMPALFTVLIAVAIVVASLFEVVPTFLLKSNVPTMATVKPYTPLELYGRDIYVREGCYNCHSQMIRPFVDEVARYGNYSRPGEFVYDHPFQWGSRRLGPDLAREGLAAPIHEKRTVLWHANHLMDPPQTSPGSIMPSYPSMFTDTIDFDVIDAHIGAMVTLGVPYDQQARDHGPDMARAQAKEIADEIAALGGQTGLADKEVVALIAYLTRLGVDGDAGIKAAAATTASAAPAGGN